MSTFFVLKSNRNITYIDKQQFSWIATKFSEAIKLSKVEYTLRNNRETTRIYFTNLLIYRSRTKVFANNVLKVESTYTVEDKVIFIPFTQTSANIELRRRYIEIIPLEFANSFRNEENNHQNCIFVMHVFIMQQVILSYCNIQSIYS